MRQASAVRPVGGRREGGLTRFLETDLQRHLQGLYDLFKLPSRPPVPIPKGLQKTDSGEYLIDGKPALDMPEGRAFFEDQRERREWPTKMALAMLTLGRLPGGAPPGAIGAFAGRGNKKRTSSSDSERVLAQTNRDPPKSLKQLQDAVAKERPGTDVHHIAEKKSARDDGFSEKFIEGYHNKVRLPRLKHRLITGFYQRYNDRLGMSPRKHLRGTSFQVRYRFGLRVLKKHGVLK